MSPAGLVSLPNGSNCFQPATVGLISVVPRSPWAAPPNACCTCDIGNAYAMAWRTFGLVMRLVLMSRVSTYGWYWLIVRDLYCALLTSALICDGSATPDRSMAF